MTMLTYHPRLTRRVFLRVTGGMLVWPSLAQSQGRTMTTSETLGATARQAVIDIFRKKDATAVDRYFGESFLQHDPNFADSLAGMKSFAAEITSSPTADITIYRTLVDGDFVLLHSRYEGVRRYGASAIAFDLFRFKDGKIVEHWGGQEPEAPPNPSGRTQVDGPTEVLDRDRTEANRTLVRTYRETVSLRFDRIEEFIEGSHYAQHASKIGDGIDRLRDRIARVAKEGGRLYLTPRRFVAEGTLYLC
jgi:predicted SnoaL-like aldol condensation-catalyzing enzyme